MELQEQKKWTLQQDTMLRSSFEEINNTFLSSIDRLEMMEKRLGTETDLLFIRLENIHSNISALKMSRLVEERILDVPVDSLSSNPSLHPLSTETSEDRTTNAIRKALKSCLVTVSKNNAGDNLYTKRPLPPIIGASEFYSSSVDKSSCTAKLEDIPSLSASSTIKYVPPPPPPPPPPTAISTPVAKSIVDDTASLRSVLAERTALTSDGSGASVANQHNQQSVVESQPIRTLPHSKGKSRFNSIFDEDDDEEVDDSHCEVSKDVAGESLLVQKIQRVTASLQNVSVSGITDQVASEKATPQNLPVVEPARRIIDDKLITEESLTSHQSTAHKKFPIGQAEKRNPSIEQSSSEAQKPVPSFESSRRLSTVKKALKSLFSSSSSEAESEEEVLAEQERTVPISAQVEEGKLSEEEMSRPVLKSFDAKFSDRLSAALKNGPVMRPDKAGSSNARRPVSTSFIPTKEEDDEGKSLISGRTQEDKISSSRSSVSSNEELGPSSVASRIAQIGDRIPGRQRSGDASTTERVGTSEAVGGKQDVNKPPVPNLVMSRAKGPARRKPGGATSNISASLLTTSDSTSTEASRSGLSSNNEASSLANPSTTSTASRKDPPPVVAGASGEPAKSQPVLLSKSVSQPPTVIGKPPPACKIKSIFDSSSSDDDFLSSSKKASKNAPVTQSSTAVTSRPSTTISTGTSRIELSKPVMVSALKSGFQNNAPLGRGSLLSAPSSKKKGLFDDSDSDI